MNAGWAQKRRWRWWKERRRERRKLRIQRGAKRLAEKRQAEELAMFNAQKAAQPARRHFNRLGSALLWFGAAAAVLLWLLALAGCAYVRALPGAWAACGPEEHAVAVDVEEALASSNVVAAIGRVPQLYRDSKAAVECIIDHVKAAVAAGKVPAAPAMHAVGALRELQMAAPPAP